MEERSLFISSCTRRQLARRRSGRARLSLPALLALLLLVAAVGAFLVAHGGV